MFTPRLTDRVILDRPTSGAILPLEPSATLAEIGDLIGGGGGGGGITWVAAPAAANSPGTAGQVAYDGSYFYVCIGTDEWARTALNSW